MPTIEQARRWYDQADPIHDFDHVLRVLRTAERLAQAEGADLEIVRAAALLHDAVGAAPPGGTAHEEAGPLPSSEPTSGAAGSAGRAQGRAHHHHQSAEFARSVLEQEGWPEERIRAVLHCIRAHRFRDTSEPPATLEARVLFDADKLDVLGAIGAARTIAYAALDGKPAYAEPSEYFLRTGETNPGEAHSAYHEYLFKLRRVKERLFTPSGRRLAESRHQYLEDFFIQLAAESRGER
jgi:uncharacterized protein